MSNSGYAIKLGHLELGEARMELDTARRLAQELLRDTVELTKQRDELLAACEALLAMPALAKLPSIGHGPVDAARAAIAIAKVTKP